MTGVEGLDAITALVVAVAIVWAGVQILSRSSRVLVDEALPQEELDGDPCRDRGVRDRPRSSGSTSCARAAAGHRRYIDLHVQFRTGTTLERAHELAHELQREIRGAAARRGRADPPRAGRRAAATSRGLRATVAHDPCACCRRRRRPSRRARAVAASQVAQPLRAALGPVFNRGSRPAALGPDALARDRRGGSDPARAAVAVTVGRLVG